LIFLDIQMPELSGIEVVERLRKLEPTPAVIFTTAFDQYAVTAFELEAIDYLLKPFGTRRFLAALERTRSVIELRGVLPPSTAPARSFRRGRTRLVIASSCVTATLS